MIFEETEDKEYIEKYTEGIEELREIVKKYTPEKTAEICGVDKDLIIQAARLYASTHKSYIAYAMGITQHVNGTDNVSSLSNLALVTGNIAGSGVNCVSRTMYRGLMTWGHCQPITQRTKSI